MAELVITRKRAFSFKDDKDKPVTLPDPDPSMTLDEVLEFYSSQYPSMLNATASTPKEVNGVTVYSISKEYKEKG